ncbi:MAG: hypothetical protein AUK23_10220 [Deltaproteobacteria bacterium CG2_30_43_15]|nr:MAG: hypothetical protein AUK23_10220 [Deltaproteobacteria bacterium CG2_30_43_15]
MEMVSILAYPFDSFISLNKSSVVSSQRALKKYPFSLQHTFFDPSKLASLKIHKLALRAQTCEFSTLRSPRWVHQKIYAIRSQGYFFKAL